MRECSMSQHRTIIELQKVIIDFCEARDWRQFHNPKDLSMSLVMEATEVMEHFQWKDTAEIRKHVALKKDEIGNEMADAFYWLLLIAYNLDIDLEKAFVRKMKQNEKKYPISKAKGNHKKYSELA